MRITKFDAVVPRAQSGLLVAALLLALNLPISGAVAQTIWNNAGIGNWSTPANWTLGVPNAASATTFDAQIKNGGTAQLSAPGASVRRMRVGVGAGGGDLLVTGGNLTITEDLILNFESGVSSRTTVQNGGVVTVPATVVGYSGAGSSAFTIMGAGSRVNATTSFVVGRAGGGGLILADGGTLAVGNGTLPLEIATLAGSTAYFNIGYGAAAGVLQASAVKFGAGNGAIGFNHTGNLTFATPITGPGNVWQSGPGTTTLTAANSYTGQTFVSGGTLVISADANLGAPSGSTLVFDGGKLRATQSFTLAATRGIAVSNFFSAGGTIEVDATKTLTYPNSLSVPAGVMTKTGAGTLSVQNIAIGGSGSSSVGVQGGGRLAVAFESVIGSGINESGNAAIADPGTSWSTNILRVGVNGTGTLAILNGGTQTTSLSFIASGPSSNGTVMVRDAGSAWLVGGNLDVGVAGVGRLDVANQALVHVAGQLAINSQSTVNLSGGTLRFDGYDRAGTFNFNSGTIQLAGNRTVGADAAIVDLFGPQPIISTGKGLTVEGTATLTTAVTLDGGTFTVGGLVNGSTLQLNRGALNITNQAVTIGAGGPLGSTLDLARDVAVNVTLGVTNQGLVTGDGQLGGRFQNAAAGELRAEPGRSLTLTGANNTNAGQVNLFGGQLEFTQNLTNNAAGFISGNGTLIARTGFVNNGTMNFSGAANVVGDVTNSATGKIISAGGGPTTFFDDVANQGQIRTSVGAFTVFFGSVSGAGAFTGPGTINVEGDLKPGNSAAAIQFAGNVAFGSDAALQIELGGVTAGSQYDRLNVTGELALGGALELSLINGFNPSVGNSFDVLDWGSRSGMFSTILLPTLSGALAWNASQLYSTGVLTVVGAGFLEADFDENGLVNGTDLTPWRNGFGTGSTHMQGNADGDGDVDGSDFLIWQRQLGSVRSAPSSNAAAVPEPGALSLALSIGGGLALVRPKARYCCTHISRN